MVRGMLAVCQSQGDGRIQVVREPLKTTVLHSDCLLRSLCPSQAAMVRSVRKEPMPGEAARRR
eukprot:747347-Hanusia_phi.AAC.1